MNRLLLALMVLSGCLNAPESSELRAYAVSSNAAERLRPVISGLLAQGKDEKPLGRADVSPDGRLLVVAPRSVQQGIASVIAELNGKPLPVPTTVRLEYWVVTASAGQGVPGPELADVAAALTDIEKTDGPRVFHLEEKIALSSMDGDGASIDGRDTKVSQRTVVLDGQDVIDVNVHHVMNHFSARLRLKPGVVAVLGTSGLRQEDRAAAARSVYFLIRATNDEAR